MSVVLSALLMAGTLGGCASNQKDVSAMAEVETETPVEESTEEEPETVLETEESEIVSEESVEETVSEESSVEETPEETKPSKETEETKTEETVPETKEAVQPEPEVSAQSEEVPESEATVSEEPQAPATSVVAAKSIDLRNCALAGQEDSINAQLAERVPPEYGNAFVAFNNNGIDYADCAGQFGSYTMSLTGKDGYWDLMVANRLKDVGNDTSLTYDINCQVLRGICDAISSEGGTLYDAIYTAFEVDSNTLPLDQWTTVGNMQIKAHKDGKLHFYIK